MGFKTFNIYFDVAALFIFAIVIGFHFQRKNLPLLQNKIYLEFLIIAFIATICDVFNTYVRIGSFYGIPFSIPIPLFWVTQSLGWISTNLLPVTYALYCLSMVDYFDTCGAKKRRIMLLLTHVPVVLIIAYVIVGPIIYFNFPPEISTKIIGFYINGAGEYIRGGGYKFMPLNSVYYFFFAAVILLKYRNRTKKHNIVIVLLYVFIMMCAVAIQTVEPKLIVQCFGISLAAIMFSSVIQTPEEYIDRTTNLFNEAAFVKMTSSYLGSGENFLCICVIVDDTLFISNNFGINRMNSIFQQVGEELTKFNKDFDGRPEVYHFEQDRFVLLFKNYSHRRISQNVFQTRAIFARGWESDGLKIKLYNRICVIECPKDVSTAEDILDLIDLVSTDSRYKKQNSVYASEIDLTNKKHNAHLAFLVREALAKDLFQVYYQPIFSIAEDRLIGAEALIRMKDEQGKFVSPEEFIPIAEKTGDILRLGEFVFESVCRTLSEISPEAYGIKKVDINLSVAQCMQENLSRNLLEKMTEYNIPAGIINLEITETFAAHTPDILLQNMNELAEAGIELSLDDYGSGFSNMSYLLSLPFRMVKIDKNIVWTAFKDSKANIALAATIAMIKRLGMTVLAEGVETKEQKEWLSSLGCDYLQGYYFDKAINKDAYLEKMKNDVNRTAVTKKAINKYLLELEDKNIADNELEEL